MKSSISKNIKEQRIKSGMSQSELADKLYVTRQTISNYETGKSNPDIETLQQLSNIWNIQIDDLLYGKEKKFFSQKVLKHLLSVIAILILSSISLYFIKKDNMIVETYYCAPAIFWITISFIYPNFLFLLGYHLTAIVKELSKIPFPLIKSKIKIIVILVVTSYNVVILPFIIQLIHLKIKIYREEYSNTIIGGNLYMGIINALIKYPILYLIFFILGIIICFKTISAINKKQE